jgi:hypothetical protein
MGKRSFLQLEVDETRGRAMHGHGALREQFPVADAPIWRGR